MSTQPNHLERLLEMQKKLKKIAKTKEAIPVVEVTEEPEQEVEIKTEPEVSEPSSNLPTKYLSLNQIKLSAKEVTTATSFVERLSDADSPYNAVQIEEKKAQKIIKSMSRLTAGTMSVAPITCKGIDCFFKESCISGDAIISGPKSKKMRDIVVGDTIYSYNTNTKQIEKDSVSAVRVTESKPLYQITTWYGNKLKITADHKVLTVTKNLETFKWKTIENGDLKKGVRILLDDIDEYVDDELETVGDAFVDIIIDIKEIRADKVYDITVNKNHNFFANSICVHNCTFYQENVHIVGTPCIVETNLLQYWAEKYKLEFNVSDDSITDLHAIGRLCTYDLYEMRLTKYLAKEDQTLLVDFVSSYDEGGRAISNKATSAAWDTIDRIDKMRSKTLKELMATREAKSKLIQTVAQAHSANSIYAAKERFEELIKLAAQQNIKPTGNIVDVDPN